VITHIIYHIPGRKVGCTKNLERRKKQYLRDEGSLPEIEILEELHDKTDQEAGDIEQHLNNRFGYRGQSHYTATIASAKLGVRKLNDILSTKRKGEIGKKAGAAAVAMGRTGFQSMSPDRMIEVARAGGLLGGQVTARIPGHMSKIAREGGARAGALRVCELKKSGCHQIGICRYCGRSMNLATLGHYHNDNCPRRPQRRS
jgi:general stress protein YciG